MPPPTFKDSLDLTLFMDGILRLPGSSSNHIRLSTPGVGSMEEGFQEATIMIGTIEVLTFFLGAEKRKTTNSFESSMPLSSPSESDGQSYFEGYLN